LPVFTVLILLPALRRIVPAVGDIPVKFQHDANSFLAGEMWKGGAQGYAGCGITLGTGVALPVVSTVNLLTMNLAVPPRSQHLECASS